MHTSVHHSFQESASKVQSAQWQDYEVDWNSIPSNESHFLCHRVHTGSVVHPTLYLMSDVLCFPGGEVTKCETNQVPLPSARLEIFNL
jgi:hypothetical protein